MVENLSILALLISSDTKIRRYYEHYKGGIYFALFTAAHSETNETMMVYQSVKTRQIWVRPLKMFNETIENNGEKIPRFRLIGDESEYEEYLERKRSVNAT